MNEQERDSDQKEHPGDLRGDPGDSRQAKSCRNETDDQKYQRVVQHRISFLIPRALRAYHGYNRPSANREKADPPETGESS